MKFIAPLILFSALVLLSSCHSASQDAKPISMDSNLAAPADTVYSETLSEDFIESDFATYYFVIADTGTDYYALRDKMYNLNQRLHLRIDTMGRSFNKKKNLIALPDDDEDEIYAGDYYPRRYPSENLSLEYLGFYQGEGQHKTIALVAGIYETEKSADSALALVKGVEQNSFKMKAEVYVGCMH